MSAQELRIKYLANEGLLIMDKDNNVLIDPLFEEDFGIYQTLSKKVQDSIIYGIGVYKNVDYLLISHEHRDHFSQDLVTQFILNHPETTIVSSDQVLSQLRTGVATFPYIQHDPDLNQNVVTSTFANITISSYWFRHPYEKNFQIKNYVFILKMNDTTIAHFGDSEWNANLLKKAPFRNYNINYVFLPLWYCIKKESPQLIEEYIHSDAYYVFHYPKGFDKSKILLDSKLLSGTNSWLDLK